ncbi:hypothetical protein HII36_52785, partial [Nonomuraea sp. NN258]|nr:hypothetical protein [Nonomuraea antri]
PRPAPKIRVGTAPAPPRRKNPMATLLLMAVLVTVIASTAAIAFAR